MCFIIFFYSVTNNRNKSGSIRGVERNSYTEMFWSKLGLCLCLIGFKYPSKVGFRSQTKKLSNVLVQHDKQRHRKLLSAHLLFRAFI